MQPFDTLSYRGQLQRLRRLALAALEQYDVTAIQLTPLQHEANTTFRVSSGDGQHYVLRIHRPAGHTVEAIRSELRWLWALREETALGVPEPVLTRNGELLTVADTLGISEPRPCVLFRWLEGRFVDKRLTPRHLAQIGTFTAQLHEQAARWQLPATFVRGRVDAISAVVRRALWRPANSGSFTPAVQPTDDDVTRTLDLVATHCSPQDATIVARTLAQIRAVFRELGEGKEVFGLIHADLHQENYLFHQGVPRAIDFDDCGWGHYLFDLTVTLREIAHLPAYPSLRAALLRGYRSIRPLPEQHESYLDTFFALRRIQLLIWVIESRDHPAFREGWVEWARNDLEELAQYLTASTTPA